jgi:hypothetical protein
VTGLSARLNFSEAFVRLATRDAKDGSWIVGHSGAGQLLPVLAERISHAGLVYVDAGLPHPGRSRLEGMPPELAGRLEALREDDGTLPGWPSWFGRTALATLINESELLESFVADCPQLPWELLIEPMPSTSWLQANAAYLLLSKGYQKDADEALALGWPTESIDGHHLWILDHPEEAAQALISLTRCLPVPRPSMSVPIK